LPPTPPPPPWPPPRPAVFLPRLLICHLFFVLFLGPARPAPLQNRPPVLPEKKRDHFLSWKIFPFFFFFPLFFCSPPPPSFPFQSQGGKGRRIMQGGLFFFGTGSVVFLVHRGAAPKRAKIWGGPPGRNVRNKGAGGPFPPNPPAPGGPNQGVMGGPRPGNIRSPGKLWRAKSRFPATPRNWRARRPPFFSWGWRIWGGGGFPEKEKRTNPPLPPHVPPPIPEETEAGQYF